MLQPFPKATVDLHMSNKEKPQAGNPPWLNRAELQTTNRFHSAWRVFFCHQKLDLPPPSCSDELPGHNGESATIGQTPAGLHLGQATPGTL